MDHIVHVVDDDPAARSGAAFLLSTLGLRCLEYDSGSALLAAVDRAPPGCILLDLLMPGMSGIETQRAIVRRGVHWPVIFVSGCDEASWVVETLRRGAVDYLLKPYTEDRLLSALHQGFVALRQIETCGEGAAPLPAAVASARCSA